MKQLCVYHPRLQALKLSNRSKAFLEEQGSIPESLLPHIMMKPQILEHQVIPTGQTDKIPYGPELHHHLETVTESVIKDEDESSLLEVIEHLTY